MRLSSIWEHFQEIFDQASSLDKARLNQLVDRQTGELLIRPSGFCLELFNAYCYSSAFRMLFDYDTDEENAIRLNYSGRENLFVSALLRELVGQRFNGAGAVMMPDVDFYAGYTTVQTDWPFEFHVFQDHDGDNDAEIAVPLLDEIMSTASNQYIQAKSDFFCCKKMFFYKNRGGEDYIMDDDSEGDVRFDDIDRMHAYIEDRSEFPNPPDHAIVTLHTGEVASIHENTRLVQEENPKVFFDVNVEGRGAYIYRYTIQGELEVIFEEDGEEDFDMSLDYPEIEKYIARRYF